MESNQCKQLQCSVANGTYTESCFGLCTPSKLTVVGAQLEDDGRTITLTLNTPAAEAHFSCDKLFSSAVVAKLGAAAKCAASGSHLVVSMSGAATIMPDDVLRGNGSIISGQKVLRGAFVNATFTSPTGNVTLATCNSCAGPVVTLSGPQVRFI